MAGQMYTAVMCAHALQLQATCTLVQMVLVVDYQLGVRKKHVVMRMHCPICQLSSRKCDFEPYQISLTVTYARRW